MQRHLGLAASLKTVLSGALRAIEFAVVTAAGLLAFVVRHDTLPPDPYLFAILVGAGLTVYGMQTARLYDFPMLRDVAGQAGPLTATWLVVTLSLMGLAFFFKVAEDFSRIWGGMWLVMSFAGLLIVRVWIASLIRHWESTGTLSTRLAVVGDPDLARELGRQVENDPESGLKVEGFYRPPGLAGADLSFDQLVARIRANTVDEVVIAVGGDDLTSANAVLEGLREVPVPVKLCPGAAAMRVPAARISRIGGVPVLDVYEQPISGWNRVFKTIEDRAGGVVLLVLLLPVMAIIALGVRLSGDGPVLFRQKRYGFNNNPITVLKFRTMVQAAEGDPDVRQAVRNDPRVTPFGRFLRRTSLDELPQLWNVVRGEMSLVGPRPHAVPHNEYYASLIGDYLGRHRVKPGITGWAQIHGFRGETATQEQMRQRIEHDLYYIENWSILMDLKILLLTPFVGFVNRNAY